MSQPAQQVKLPTFNLHLEGVAAQMVIDKIEEKKKAFGLTRFGKDRATQILLCELYELKNKKTGND